MKTAENFLRALIRAILANPEIEPEISIESTLGRNSRVEIDVRPFDPAPLIGSGGTMKFAMQTVLSGVGHPTQWDIVFRTSGRTMSPRLRDITPQSGVMISVVESMVAHWRASGLHCNGSVELSPTAALAILGMEESLGNAQRGAVSRIARAVGKANGYRAAAIIEKLAMTA